MYLNTNCYFTLLIGPFSTRIHWFLSTSSANRSAGSTSQVSHVFLFYQGYHVSTINGRKEKTGKEVHSESGTSRTELTLDSRSLGLFTPGHMPIEATSNTNHFSFALCLSFWVRFPSRFVWSSTSVLITGSLTATSAPFVAVVGWRAWDLYIEELGHCCHEIYFVSTLNTTTVSNQSAGSMKARC